MINVGLASFTAPAAYWAAAGAGLPRRVAARAGWLTALWPLSIYWSGYVQDAQKEYAEARIVHGLIGGTGAPSPQQLLVEDAVYLNGLGEAAGELRRYALDRLRAGETARAEWALAAMDDIYGLLVTVDFPDAITGGLRRTTDMVRGVLERTRGDVTVTLRQQVLEQALTNAEWRMRNAE